MGKANSNKVLQESDWTGLYTVCSDPLFFDDISLAPTSTTFILNIDFSRQFSTVRASHFTLYQTMADVQEAPKEELALTTTSTDIAEQQPTAGKKVKKIIRRKKRPARPQIDPALIKSEPPPQTGTIFNIWYNKWSGGDREDKYLSQTAAKGRCNIAKDSGYTKADRVTGSYFCLFFARGICTCLIIQFYYQ